MDEEENASPSRELPDVERTRSKLKPEILAKTRDAIKASGDFISLSTAVQMALGTGLFLSISYLTSEDVPVPITDVLTFAGLITVVTLIGVLAVGVVLLLPLGVSMMNEKFMREDGIKDGRHNITAYLWAYGTWLGWGLLFIAGAIWVTAVPQSTVEASSRPTLSWLLLIVPPPVAHSALYWFASRKGKWQSLPTAYQVVMGNVVMTFSFGFGGILVATFLNFPARATRLGRVR